jgi:hypothetical protein
VHGPAEVIDGEEVHQSVADEVGCGELVEYPVQAGPWCPAFRGTPPGPHGGAGAVGGVGQVEQMPSLGIVELEGSGDCIEDGGGDAAERSAFQLGVVLDAHPGEGGDFGPT